LATADTTVNMCGVSYGSREPPLLFIHRPDSLSTSITDNLSGPVIEVDKSITRPDDSDVSRLP